MVKRKRMDKTIRECASSADPDEIEAQEYRYWQSRPMHERMDQVSKLSSAMYAVGDGTDAPRLDKTLVRIKRPL